jgi:hypothetical protein
VQAPHYFVSQKALASLGIGQLDRTKPPHKNQIVNII